MTAPAWNAGYAAGKADHSLSRYSVMIRTGETSPNRYVRDFAAGYRSGWFARRMA
jgi:hypothetical protein